MGSINKYDSQSTNDDDDDDDDDDDASGCDGDHNIGSEAPIFRHSEFHQQSAPHTLQSAGLGRWNPSMASIIHQLKDDSSQSKIYAAYGLPGPLSYLMCVCVSVF